jgi:phosphonate transport system substrate-binding protein
MNRRLFLTCFLAALPLSSESATPQQSTGQAGRLRLGIVPFNSALVLFQMHQPLRAHLEKALGQPVTLYTSVDHARFYEETLASAFDIVVISPHLGVMAMEAGFLPLLRYRKEMRIGIIVRKENRAWGISGLRGKRIGIPDRLSIFSVGGRKWLDESNLGDCILSMWPSHGATIAAVAAGNLDAALSVLEILRQIPKDLSDTLTFLPFGESIPHLMVLCRAELGKEQAARIRAALLSFPDSPAGQDFFRITGYQGYIPISERDIRIMRPYVELTRKLLESPE